jgi:hypothetical protein
MEADTKFSFFNTTTSPYYHKRGRISNIVSPHILFIENEALSVKISRLD